MRDQLCSTAYWTRNRGVAGDGTHPQISRGLVRQPTPLRHCLCHCLRIAPSCLALLSVNLKECNTRCICAGGDLSALLITFGCYNFLLLFQETLDKQDNL